jgi:Anti-anti-sigma regulatory factor (antagonist of anti-sigma factor)
MVEEVSVVDVAGRITLGEGASMLRENIRDLVGKGNKKILLNLNNVSYIDSSGIGELVSGFTTVTNQGGVLKLLGLTKRSRTCSRSPSCIRCLKFTTTRPLPSAVLPDRLPCESGQPARPASAGQRT